MATENSRVLAPGVRMTEYVWFNEYFGSAEALISAGLVRTNQLPGQPGMAKSCVTFYDDERVERRKQPERNEKFLRIQTAGKKFTVTQGVSIEVKAARRGAEAAQREAEREVERAAAAARAANEREIARSKMIAEGTLGLMPTSPNDYRKKLIAEWDGYARCVRKSMLPSKGNGSDIFSMGINGFSLDESDINEFDDLVNEIKGLLMNAGVRFNAQRQKEIISSCQGAVAKGDSKFQRVLAACTE